MGKKGEEEFNDFEVPLTIDEAQEFCRRGLTDRSARDGRAFTLPTGRDPRLKVRALSKALINNILRELENNDGKKHLMRNVPLYLTSDLDDRMKGVRPGNMPYIMARLRTEMMKALRDGRYQDEVEGRTILL